MLARRRGSIVQITSPAGYLSWPGATAYAVAKAADMQKTAGLAQSPVKGSVMASDAFFPFRDGLDEAAGRGVTAVIQPGGSVRDEEVIAAAEAAMEQDAPGDAELEAAVTRAEARQLVSHGAILVNGKRVDVPSYQVAAGDTIEVREKARVQSRIQNALADLRVEVITDRATLRPRAAKVAKQIANPGISPSGKRAFALPPRVCGELARHRLELVVEFDAGKAIA